MRLLWNVVVFGGSILFSIQCNGFSPALVGLGNKLFVSNISSNRCDLNMSLGHQQSIAETISIAEPQRVSKFTEVSTSPALSTTVNDKVSPHSNHLLPLKKSFACLENQMDQIVAVISNHPTVQSKALEIVLARGERVDSFSQSRYPYVFCLLLLSSDWNQICFDSQTKTKLIRMIRTWKLSYAEMLAQVCELECDTLRLIQSVLTGALDSKLRVEVPARTLELMPWIESDICKSGLFEVTRQES